MRCHRSIPQLGCIHKTQPTLGKEIISIRPILLLAMSKILRWEGRRWCRCSTIRPKKSWKRYLDNQMEFYFQEVICQLIEIINGLLTYKPSSISPLVRTTRVTPTPSGPPASASKPSSISSGRKDNMTVLTEIQGQRALTGALNIKDNRSALIRSLNQQELTDVTKDKGLFWFDQGLAVLLKTFQEAQGINRFWRLVSTTTTNLGLEQVSTVEAYDFPFFMVQYHPQNNNFQWNIGATRTYNAISVSQKFINEFMKVARTNKNKMSEQQFGKRRIQNSQPFFPPADCEYTQVYLFDQNLTKKPS